MKVAKRIQSELSVSSLKKPKLRDLKGIVGPQPERHVIGNSTAGGDNTIQIQKGGVVKWWPQEELVPLGWTERTQQSVDSEENVEEEYSANEEPTRVERELNGGGPTASEVDCNGATPTQGPDTDRPLDRRFGEVGSFNVLGKSRRPNTPGSGSVLQHEFDVIAADDLQDIRLIELELCSSKRSASGYRGVVSLPNGGFRGQVQYDGQTFVLGVFESLEDTARLVHHKHCMLHGSPPSRSKSKQCRPVSAQPVVVSDAGVPSEGQMSPEEVNAVLSLWHEQQGKTRRREVCGWVIVGKQRLSSERIERFITDPLDGHVIKSLPLLELKLRDRSVDSVALGKFKTLDGDYPQKRAKLNNNYENLDSGELVCDLAGNTVGVVDGVNDATGESDCQMEEDDAGDVLVATECWTQCDGCSKWRRRAHAVQDEDAEWQCMDNDDSRYNSCQVQQELSDKEIDRRIEALQVAATVEKQAAKALQRDTAG